jgi:predicted Zn-dependent protease
MSVLGRDVFHRIADPALELPDTAGVEVLLMHEWGGLTRFANSQIHQSTATDDTSIRVRVALDGGRVGVAATNEATPEGARAAAASAFELASVATGDPLWPGLAPLDPTEPVGRFDDATEETGPETRAKLVADLIRGCPEGSLAAGACETGAVEVALANTSGQVCWDVCTRASLSTVVGVDGSGSGYADACASAVGAIDPGAIATRAGEKATRSQRPAELAAGTYPVVLEPSAVATLIEFLSWIGFEGRSYVEDRSCLSGKSGTAVAAPAVSIWDDATAEDTIGVGFDFEGVPKRRVDLIRDGVFLDAVYDLRTAKQAGRSAGSTGHGLPSPNPEGPFPLHPAVGAGDASVEEMIAGTEQGVLVTRFHYANVVNPMESSITGMTRDGTFRIEGGEVAGPVRNLRFTQSVLGALAGVTRVGRETELVSEWSLSATRVPALAIGAFHFSGVSDH